MDDKEVQKQLEQAIKEVQSGSTWNTVFLVVICLLALCCVGPCALML